MTKPITFVAILLVAVSCLAQSPTPMLSSSYSVSVSGTQSAVAETSSGVGWHQIVWRISGTVTGCSVQLDSDAGNAPLSFNSADGIASQTCTSNGTATSAAALYANNVRVNMTALTCTGSCTIFVTYMGFTGNPAAFQVTGTGTANKVARWTSASAMGTGQISDDGSTQVNVTPGVLRSDANKVVLTADWTCGTGGTVGTCVSAVIIGSGGGVPMTFTLPLVAASYQLDCDLVVGQATADTANNWNLLTATNGATNVSTLYDMYTAATAKAAGVTTGQASTTTTFNIGAAWTLGGLATKMPAHIHAAIEGASVSGTVVSLQLVAPTIADLVTIYRGSACTIR